MSNQLPDKLRLVQGTISADIFKRKHKDEDKNLLASDVDFIWVDRFRIISLLELKNKESDSGATFAQSVAYKDFINAGFPLHLVKFRLNEDDQLVYDICVWKVNEIDPYPFPPKWKGDKMLSNADWDSFIQWEKEMRVNETTK